MKKMYIVKREVIAGSIKEALTKKGFIFEVIEAEPQFHPKLKKGIGFINKKK